jgi:hypothetical protein
MGLKAWLGHLQILREENEGMVIAIEYFVSLLKAFGWP